MLTEADVEKFYMSALKINVSNIFISFPSYASQYSIHVTLTTLTQPEISKHLSVEVLRQWYNGYETANGIRIYNAYSVSRALECGRPRSYWTDTGVFHIISMPIWRHDLSILQGVPTQLMRMIALAMGPTKRQLFQLATGTADEIDVTWLDTIKPQQ